MLGLFCVLNAAAQTPEPTPDPEKVAVDEIFLAKDNGEGKAGDVADSFATTDIPIYCIVQLNSTKPATVRMNLIAVEVQGVKAESKVISISYTTNGRQNRVSFKGKPDKLWTAGRYRIDIFVDDQLAVGKAFDIKGSPSDIQKSTPVGSFVEPKPKPKPKVVKPNHKN